MRQFKLWGTGAVLAFGLTVSAFAQQITQDDKNKILDGISEVVAKRAFVPGVDFSKWPEFLEKNRAKIDEADEIGPFSTQVNGALRQFGLSHIVLMTPRAASARNQTSVVGIGVQIEPVKEGLKIAMVREGSPAKEAGLLAGDIITKVDGKEITGENPIAGEEGITRHLDVLRADGTTKTFDIVLKKISLVQTEELTWPKEDTAMFRVYTFMAGYGRQNLEKIMVDAGKAKNLIIDLRSNGGGAVNNLNHFLSIIMPGDTPYGTFISRPIADQYQKEKPEGQLTAEAIAEWASSKTKTRARTGITPFKGQIIVMINGGTGSASEIAAAALREDMGAKIVGTPSAGAVLASTYAGLPNGFSLQYPVSDYVTIKGTRLEGHPIKPDVEVKAMKQGAADDPGLAAALKLCGAADEAPKALSFLYN